MINLGDILRDESLFLVWGGIALVAWFWTFIRVATMPSTWLKWVALVLCFLPAFTFGSGDTFVRAPVLFPVALVISYFAVKRSRPSARTTLERMTGG